MSARFLNLLLLAALVGGSALAYPRLPARIPMHFGLSGTPDRWAETSLFSWFLLPLIAVALNLMLYGIAALTLRDARLINLPGKERLLALPVERQRAVLDRIRDGLGSLAVPLTLAFCLIQLGVYRTAMGTGGRVEVLAALIVIVLASPVAVIRMMRRTQAELDRQVRQEREAAAP